MAKSLEIYGVAISPGGLQDSKSVPQPGDMLRLEQFVGFRGRWGLRPPVTQLVQLMDDQVTPAPVTDILQIADFAGAIWAVTYSSTTGKTYLHEINKDTFAEVRKVVVWTAGGMPRPVLARMAGGAADIVAAQDRLYICDYLQSASRPTVFFRRSDNTLQTLLLALDGTTTARSVFFSHMIEWQHHMWGAGFLENDGTNIIVRPELVRFSTPGLVPFPDPDVAALTQEWWTNDHRGVARREDKITCLAQAGGGLLAAKRRELYVISGFDRSSWAREQISSRVGIVGPYAADWTEEGICYFWSESGPARTDGRAADISIAEDVRRRVNESLPYEYLSVAYSADDGIVYFSRMLPGEAVPASWFAFDVKRDRWAEGWWFGAGGAKIQIADISPITSESVSGPMAAPSGLTATTVDQNRIDLSWTNGDTSIGIVTEIEAQNNLAAAGCLGTWAKIAEVGAGISAYSNTGLTSKRYNCYRVRHRRSGVNSAYSNQVSDRQTELADPTGLTAEALSTGVRIKFTNNEGGADIQVERRSITDGGGYVLITTLAAQVAGQITYDDTTGTCGKVYEYRVRAVLTGWPSSDYSNTAQKEACLSPPAITSVTHSVSLTADCPTSTNVTINYTASNVKPGDTRKIYRIVDAGAPQLLSDGPLQSAETFFHLWGVRSGATPTTFKARVEAYEGGTILRSTLDSTASSHNTGTPCPEE